MSALSSVFLSSKPHVPDIARPQLDLSGEALSQALDTMVSAAEEHGGIERYVEAIKLKSALFGEALAGESGPVVRERFLELCAFMPTVRRRLAPYLDDDGFVRISSALAVLLDGRKDVTTTDARMAEFCTHFPQNPEHRFIRDLAAEVLHNLDPERYPLMTRWVWDAKANTGVLREIWFDENIDRISIRVDDTYATYLMLREELAQFLSTNGIYRDMPAYVDALCAQVYAQYICGQGGLYLRADFSAPDDPMLHARRMLGLDGVRPGSMRLRLKAIDGSSHAIDDTKMIG